MQTVKLGTKQEVFDRIAEHMLTQKKKSKDDHGDCSYRGKKGRMCGVGCLIPDDVYRRNMEGESVKTLRTFYILGFKIKDMNASDTITFLAAFQAIHDEKKVKEWFQALTDLGRWMGLSTLQLRRFY